FLGGGTRGPGDADSRRNITPVVNIGLGFIAQPETHRKVGTHTPIVTHERSDIELAGRETGCTGVEAELRGAASQSADRAGRTSQALKQQRAAIEIGRASCREGE